MPLNPSDTEKKRSFWRKGLSYGLKAIGAVNGVLEGYPPYDYYARMVGIAASLGSIILDAIAEKEELENSKKLDLLAQNVTKMN